MDIISKLKNSEDKAIIEGLTMMTYNPSIGRVFEKGGVDKFREIIIEKVKQLENIDSQDKFDEWHHSIIEKIRTKIKTNKGDKPSYGQAQKPLNVFLKVFVDWAGRPTLGKASQLRKFLHVPLDSILMGEIKDKLPNVYEKCVVNAYDSIRKRFKMLLIQQGKEENDEDLQKFIGPSNFSLDRIIFKEMYYAWQVCLRAIYPEKPILLDVLWSLRRKNKSEEF